MCGTSGVKLAHRLGKTRNLQTGAVQATFEVTRAAPRRAKPRRGNTCMFSQSAANMKRQRSEDLVPCHVGFTLAMSSWSHLQVNDEDLDVFGVENAPCIAKLGLRGVGLQEFRALVALLFPCPCNLVRFAQNCRHAIQALAVRQVSIMCMLPS